MSVKEFLGADSRSKAIAIACQIDGWLSENEAGCLYDLAKRAKGPIVEIGSYMGRSTAALALGSMAGSRQPVYAIDPFIGAQNGSFPSAFGLQIPCSEELLRANLDKAGVNGLVRIVAKPSQEAVDNVPVCGLLFVDGAHDYEHVSQDLKLYLPKVELGGNLVCHDVGRADPDVVRAVEEQVMGAPQTWMILGRVDSAIVAERKIETSYRVALGFPGPTLAFGAAKGLMQASLGSHKIDLHNSGNGWDDFNVVWANSLNSYESGDCTHFAMMHSDIIPDPGWLDILIAEMDRLGADLVSATAPLKDGRGLTSDGIGDMSYRWGAFRRFTVRETFLLPETFTLADIRILPPHVDYASDPLKYLLHNTGCWVCDLRNPLFFQTHSDGGLKCFFDFPTHVARNEKGLWVSGRESEDWFFSRNIHLLGAKTYITRKVRLAHRGLTDYQNWEPWGSYLNGDKDTATKWQPKGELTC